MRGITRRRAGALLVLVLGAVGAMRGTATAQVPELTGTWNGKVVCKVATAGVKTKIVATPTLAVTQNGNAVAFTVDYGNGTIDRYTGLVNPDGKKPLVKGELGVIRCGTDSVATDGGSDEIGRLFAATKPAPAVKATLKGQSVFSAPPAIGTCSWKWTRIDAADPGVGTGCIS